MGQMEVPKKNGEKIVEPDSPHADTKANRHEEQEPTPLQDLLVRLQLSEAQFRMDRDGFLAGLRDHLHYALQLTGPIDPKRIHEVIDKLDDFLNHRSRK